MGNPDGTGKKILNVWGISVPVSYFKGQCVFEILMLKSQGKLLKYQLCLAEPF